MRKENKIDPGPGYRILGPEERVASGDEFTDNWRTTQGAGFLVGTGVYRRKCLLESFASNKYTRWVPTLDGLTAPVDVYGVSEAFDIRSHFTSAGAVEAILHGRKKLLAPGQRGAKSALQDIKEARDSLNRAIALEEAALERGNKE